MEDAHEPEHRVQFERRRRNIVDFLNRHGLTKEKIAKLAGRVNPKLLKLARERTGAESDSQLIELALGNLVIYDGFPEAFKKSRGAVDPKVDFE